MKNKFVFAGLVAMGAAGLQTTFAESLDLISPKNWNVSATLRGFYDDNYNIAGNKKGSVGAEFSPSISLNVPLRQTDIGLRYTYGLYYYQDRQDLNLNAFDQTHQVDVWLDHAFNERWKLNVTDTVAIGQEPDLIGPTSISTPSGVLYRVQGDNLANHGTVKLDTEWTRLFSTSLQYGNNFYDYQNSGATLGGPASGLVWLRQTGVPGGVSGFQFLGLGGPSLAGLLNRVEQNVSLDLQWNIQPETMVFVGYNLGLVNYTGNEPVGVYNYLTSPAPGTPGSLVYHSADRDSLSHYGYVGVQHDFTANVRGTVKGGVTYTDSYNDPLDKSTTLTPYADLSVSYTYIPGSYVQLGFTHDINATDNASVDQRTGSLTQNQESSVLYASINHRITQDLIATVIGRCQYSTYNGGAANNEADTTYGLGVNLHYQISRHFSADAGYNYDNLVSDVAGRGYERNRVYLGLGANY